MKQVLVVLLKDFIVRKNHFILTGLEILLPVSIIILLNITPFPKVDPPNNYYMNDTINKTCSYEFLPDLHTQISYEPFNNFTFLLMSNVKCLGEFQDVRSGNIDENNSNLRIGVKFKGLDHLTSGIPDKLEYELYPNAKYWNNIYNSWGDVHNARYSYSYGPLKKFLRIQHAIDDSFLNLLNITTPQISFQNMDLFGGDVKVYEILVMLAFFLGFSLMVPGIVGRLVQEKLSGAKELMLLMGLKRHHLWCARLMECLIIFGVVQLFIVIFMYAPLTENSHVLQTVSPFFMWLYLMYALTGVITFLFFFSCLFSNPTFGVFMAEVVWGFSIILYSLASTYSTKISKSLWIIFCVLPHFCFFTGLSILLDFDYYGKSIKLGETLSKELNYPTLCDILIMFAFDIILYSVLTWYSDQINPGPFGVEKPYNFCFKKSYWIPQMAKSGYDNSLVREMRNGEDFEAVSNRAGVGISVVNMSKEFRSLTKGTVLAVDNVNIDFYSGEISSLLGHNGAGKTTMFSVISGLIQASSGKVVIDGYDVGENTEMARKRLGLCPQHDMLFMDINVQETLLFYGLIKGLTRKEAREEANELIQKLKLSEVKTTLAAKLSGGQKRKVSLAIALIGGSKVVLLDEPTSGLDPEMRRELWDILMEFRGSRTILLTTHFMEEADALSDRIAIMDHGRIKCYGTPMYLKSKYGCGYTLSVLIKETGNGCKMEKFIQKFVKTAKLKSQNVLTLSYQLPQDEVSNFPKLFSALNEMQNSGEINSYSVSFSTFEDVFIRLRGLESECATIIDMVDSSPYKKLNSNETHLPKVNCLALPFYQIYALLVKKWIYILRNFRVFFLFTMIPILYIMFKYMIMPAIEGHIAKNPAGNGTGNESFTYSLDLYRDTTALYTTAAQDNIVTAFERFVANAGLDARRVNNISEELMKIFQDDFYTYSKKTSFGINFNNVAKGEINVFHNSYAVHMVPVSLHTIYNSLLLANNKSSYIKASVNLKYSIREKNQLDIHLRQLQNPLDSCFLASIPNVLGIPVLFFLIGPVREKSLSAKHLQLMTTSSVLYWLSHLIFDVVLFLAYLFVALLLVGVSNKDEFCFDSKGEVISGFVLWSIGLLVGTYIVSSFMKNLGAATSIIMAVYFIFTFLVYDLVRWGLWNKNYRYLHPSSIFKIGLDNVCMEENDNFIGALIIYDVLMFAFLILKDSHILSIFHRYLSSILKIDYSDLIEKNVSVVEHEKHVQTLVARKEFSRNSLVVKGLKRWYLTGFRCRPRATVRGISFAVEKGECFGFLGVNGAGKTTSFKMMTGSLQASKGQAFVNGCNLFSPIQQSKGLFHMGYCPQYGGYIPGFRGSELLTLFARLRGVKASHVIRERKKWIEELDLLEHINTPVEKYSGGNQRKLLVGIALIGGPPVILLDEPTSGVDPVSRRLIWKVIDNLRKEGKSILLTSHSMDECEAVCTRLAIMVKGSFRCFGEITTLKDTFGKGFTVQLKVNTDATRDEWNGIKDAMVSEFGPSCNLTDEHSTILEYHITDKNMKWDSLFMKLINLKEKQNRLESFSASATTLEQIFISCARGQ